MFDIGAAELLVIVIVAILVIGPKDMPVALRTAGQWIGKIRRVSSHFRTGLDAMVREAELEEMEKKWKAQNEAIMARSTADTPPDPALSKPPSADTGKMTGPPPVDRATGAEAAESREPPGPDPKADDPAPAPKSAEPELPLGKNERD